MTSSAPPGWHADPFARFEFRFWDGGRWTAHVSAHGQVTTDPPVPGPLSPVANPSIAPGPASASRTTRALRPDRAAERIRRQVEHVRLSHTVGQPDLELLSEPILVLAQRGKLLELKADFSVFDRNGSQLATVRGKRTSSRMEVVDMNERSLIDLRRESSVLRSRTVVADGDGAKIGSVVPSLSPKKSSRAFKLEGPGGRAVGGVFSEDLRRRDFNVQDTRGSVATRISKTRAGWAKELFTKGDHYVVEFTPQATPSLRLLGLAAALVIDRTFHQH